MTSPRRTDGRLHKVHVPGTGEDPGEALWAEAISDREFAVDNIPIQVPGLSLGDVVAAQWRGGPLEFERVVRKSGHSTYRVMFQRAEPTGDDVAALQRLRDRGCHTESATARYHALDVPAELDLSSIYDAPESEMARGTWWFDELDVGHPLDSGRSPEP